jgi:hypothetical protein
MDSIRLVLVENSDCTVHIFGRSDFSANVVHNGFRHDSTSSIGEAFDETTSSEMAYQPRGRITNVLEHGLGIFFELK